MQRKRKRKKEGERREKGGENCQVALLGG